MIDISASGHYVGDCRDLLAQLPERCIQTCVTSPPYWGLRDYGHDEQIGLEKTPDEYVAALVHVFRGVRRVLRDDGTLWLNLGDSYARSGGTQSGRNRELLHMDGKQHRMTSIPDGSCLKPKDLVGIPWLVAFALRADGWYLRQDIIWHKPSSMPESVRDRCTKAHEYVFLLSKSERYYFDAKAIREPQSELTIKLYGHRQNGEQTRNRNKLAEHQGGSNGDSTRNVNHDLCRNRRSVWTITSQPYSGAHFAVMPSALAEPCVLAGSRPGDIVLDPFFGSGTVGAVAEKHGRKWIGVDLNAEYAELAKQRTAQRSLVMPTGAAP